MSSYLYSLTSLVVAVLLISFSRCDDIPLGTILDWYNFGDCTDDDVPSSYQICNGSLVTNPNSPFYNLYVPDLRGSFTRGVGTCSDIGLTGGFNSSTTSSDGTHTHTVTVKDGSCNAFCGSCSGCSISACSCSGNVNPSAVSSPTGSDGAHTHTVSTLPPYFSVLKIIKVIDDDSSSSSGSSGGSGGSGGSNTNNTISEEVICVSSSLELIAYYQFPLEDPRKDSSGNYYRLFNMTYEDTEEQKDPLSFTLPINGNPYRRPDFSIVLRLNVISSDFPLLTVPLYASNNPKNATGRQLYLTSSYQIAVDGMLTPITLQPNAVGTLAVSWQATYQSVSLLYNYDGDAEIQSFVSNSSYVPPISSQNCTMLFGRLAEGNHVQSLYAFSGPLSSKDFNCILARGDKCVALPSYLPSEVQPKPDNFQPLYQSRLITEYTVFTDTLTNDNYTYMGSTIAGVIVLQDQISGRFSYMNYPSATDYDVINSTYAMEYPTGPDEFDLQDPLQVAIYGSIGWKPAYSYEQLEITTKDGRKVTIPILQLFLDHLRESTIRGVRIIDVLQFLENNAGNQFALSVVGGTVRDTLAGERANDVDVAISSSFTSVIYALRDIFKVYGTPIDNTVLHAEGVRRIFGMIKVDNVPVVDDLSISDCQKSKSDPLDVGVHKGFSIVQYANEENGWDANGKETLYSFLTNNDTLTLPSKYLYGFSYLRDAYSRDYTTNAVYLEPFGTNPKIIDVFGNGIEDSRKKKLHFARHHMDDSKSNQLFEHDLGAQFRFWKLLMKPPGKDGLKWTLPEEQASEMIYLVSNAIIGWRHKEGQVDFFWRKMMKKLFSVGVPQPEIETVLTLWRKQIIGMSNSTEISSEAIMAAQSMWDQIIAYARSDNTRLYCSHMYGENPESYTISNIIKIFAKQTPFENGTFSFYDRDRMPFEVPRLDRIASSSQCHSTMVYQYLEFFSSFGPVVNLNDSRYFDSPPGSSSEAAHQYLTSESLSYGSYEMPDYDDDDGYYIFGFPTPPWTNFVLTDALSKASVSVDRLFLAFVYEPYLFSSSVMNLYFSALASANPLAFSVYTLIVDDVPFTDLVEELNQIYANATLIERYVSKLEYSAQYPNSTVHTVVRRTEDFCVIGYPADVCFHVSSLIARMKREYWLDFSLFSSSNAPHIIMLEHEYTIPYSMSLLDWKYLLYSGQSPPTFTNQTSVSLDQLATLSETLHSACISSPNVTLTYTRSSSRSVSAVSSSSTTRSATSSSSEGLASPSASGTSVSPSPIPTAASDYSASETTSDSGNSIWPWYITLILVVGGVCIAGMFIAIVVLCCYGCWDWHQHRGAWDEMGLVTRADAANEQLIVND